MLRTQSRLPKSLNFHQTFTFLPSILFWRLLPPKPARRPSGRAPSSRLVQTPFEIVNGSNECDSSIHALALHSLYTRHFASLKLETSKREIYIPHEHPTTAILSSATLSELPEHLCAIQHTPQNIQHNIQRGRATATPRPYTGKRGEVATL